MPGKQWISFISLHPQVTYSTKLGVHCFVHLLQIQEEARISAKIGLHALMDKYDWSSTSFRSGDSAVIIKNEFGLETV